MANALNSFNNLKDIVETMEKNGACSLNQPKFFQFVCMNKNQNIYIAAYLQEDYERTSPEFKRALQKYQNVIQNFKLVFSARNDLLSNKEELIIEMAERKFLKLEKREGIRRISSLEQSKMINEYQNQIEELAK